MEAQTRKQRKITSERIDQTKPAFMVVNAFGGLTRFCEITGFAPSTVHSWLVNGLIPSRYLDDSDLGRISYQAWILVCAERNKVKMAPAIFVEPLAA